MEQKKKGSPSRKEPQTRAEHLQSKGISLPKRIEGKPSGAAIAPRRGRKG